MPDLPLSQLAQPRISPIAAVLPVPASSPSRLVTELLILDPELRRALRGTDVLLAVCDGIVAVAHILTDDANPIPWQSRLKEYLDDLFGQLDVEALDSALPADPEALGRFVRNLTNHVYQRFAKRLLGAATFSRLEQAFKEDAAVVVVALRRALRAAMPLSVAWRDTLGLMTPQQLKAISTTNSLGADVFDILLKLDEMVDERVIPKLPLGSTSATTADLSRIDRDDLDRLYAQFQALISQESVERIKQVSASLTAKIHGARHALEHSADGISQAANSLVELIDRLLRFHFDDSTVLAWVERNLPDDHDLVYTDGGTRCPTKRAQALCFVYAGDPVLHGPDQPPGPSMIHDVLARSFVAARNQLQQLKHADNGDNAERTELLQILKGIEGTVLLTLRFGWALAPTKALKRLSADLEDQGDSDFRLSA